MGTKTAILLAIGAAISIGAAGCSRAPVGPPPPVRNLQPDLVLEEPAGPLKVAPGDPFELKGYVVAAKLDLVAFQEVLAEFREGDVSLGTKSFKVSEAADPDHFGFASRITAPTRSGSYTLIVRAQVYKAISYSPDGKLTEVDMNLPYTSKSVKVEVR